MKARISSHNPQPKEFIREGSNCFHHSGTENDVDRKDFCMLYASRTTFFLTTLLSLDKIKKQTIPLN